MATNYYTMIDDALIDFYDDADNLHYYNKTAEATIISAIDNIFPKDFPYNIEIVVTGFDCGALCISWIDEKNELCCYNFAIDYM